MNNENKNQISFGDGLSEFSKNVPEDGFSCVPITKMGKLVRSGIIMMSVFIFQNILIFFDKTTNLAQVKQGSSIYPNTKITFKLTL